MTQMNCDYIPQIDTTKCIGCELCVKQCPNQALAMEEGIAVVAHSDRCDYSGYCQEICPTEAISLVYFIAISKDDERRLLSF